MTMVDQACYAVGIDLGTTYTRVAVLRDGGIEVVPEDGFPAMPSCVAYTPTTVLVGAAAKNQARANSSNTIFEALRFLGRSFRDNEIQQWVKIFPFKIIERSSGICFRVIYKGETIDVSPTEILAIILAKAKRNAEAYLGHVVHVAAIIVPTKYGARERRLIEDVARVAGLKDVALLSSATAAASYYPLVSARNSEERNVLFVDLGAAGANVTLATIEDSIVEVRAVAGDHTLGGSLFDLRLFRHCVRYLRASIGGEVDTTFQSGATDLVTSDPVISEPWRSSRLLAACERAKRDLSSQRLTMIHLESFYNGKDFQITLDTVQFAELCRDLTLSLLDPIESVLRRSRFDRSSVHEIVVIGGSSRIPSVQQVLSDFFYGKAVSKAFIAEDIAARGAAAQASIRFGQPHGIAKLKETLLINASSITVGIEHPAGLMTAIVKRGTTIPTIKRETITIEPYFKGQEICVFEGESARTKNNLFLGAVQLPPSLTGTSRNIEVTFAIQNTGLLTVSLRSLSSQQCVEKVMDTVGKLPAKEIERLRSTLHDFQEDERLEALRIEKRNRLENQISDLAAMLHTPDLTSRKADRLRPLIDSALEWVDSNPWASSDDYVGRCWQLQMEFKTLEELMPRLRVTRGSPEAKNIIVEPKAIQESPDAKHPTLDGNVSQESPKAKPTAHSRKATQVTPKVEQTASSQARLGPRQIQLLYRVDSGSMAFERKIHKVDYPPRFRALSYAWGSQAKDRTLVCYNEGRTILFELKISETLHQALEELTKDDMPIWADAICINQNDPVEKSQQVALMHQIYRRADSVAIWLGPHRTNTAVSLDLLRWVAAPPTFDTDEKSLALFPALQDYLQRAGSNLHLDHVRRLASAVVEGKHVPINRLDFHRKGLPHLDHPLWTALGLVLSPPWLTRLWTFQELLLGRRCIVVMGDVQLPWVTYFDVGMRFSRCNLLDHCISKLSYSQTFAQRAATAFLRLTPFLDNENRIVPFWRYLDEARSRDVTEAVDRVYAVLSLANDALRSRIAIKYSQVWKSQFWKLYVEAAKAIMSTSPLQSILAATNSEIKSPDLPSWCPDFSQPCETKSLDVNACAGLQYGKSFASSHDPRTISIGGAELCTILYVDSTSWLWLGDSSSTSIYGPHGAAAHNLQWLESCWLTAQSTYRGDEAGAQRAYVLTLLGLIRPSILSDIEERAWFAEAETSLSDLRAWLENLQLCAGPEDVEETSDRWHRFQAMSQRLDGIWHNRRLCATDNGRIGIVSRRAKPGDRVVLFFGETHVYVLRAWPSGTGVYGFVSDAYVGGYMDMSSGQEGAVESVVFQLR